MIVFYCKFNATVRKSRLPYNIQCSVYKQVKFVYISAQIPVLVRSLNPPQSMWAEVFNMIQGAGLNFAWLDLMCRAPVSNGTEIITKAQDIYNREYMPYFHRIPKLTSYERAVLTQHILRPYVPKWEMYRAPNACQ